MKIVYLVTSCKESGPIKQTLNIIKHLDPKLFEPIMVTIFPERGELSRLQQFLPYVKHYYAPTSKLQVIMCNYSTLHKTLTEIQPDVIHSLGVFPDFAVSRMKEFKQLITLRNFVWDDYPAKFGKIIGSISAMLHVYAMKHSDITVTCSESLARIYKERLDMTYGFVRNGVDIEQYTCADQAERLAVRKECNLPTDCFVFVYTGQLIERKNMDFLLSTFKDNFCEKDAYLLVLGGGAMFEELKAKYGKVGNIDFRGNVSNVNRYLKGCDAYVSASKSEGLPNGVMEAMATGLPVILSDIPQHIEVHEANTNCGYIFDINSSEDLARCMREMMATDYRQMGQEAYQSAHENFSAQKMSKQYQRLYMQLAGLQQVENGGGMS